MNTDNDIMRALGRIEGELVEIRKLAERVSRLEQWQAWLKGAWAILASAFAYLCKAAYRNPILIRTTGPRSRGNHSGLPAR